MSTGAVILAFNNSATDYVGLACWSAANIRRHLGIPTAVITDQPTDARLASVDCVIEATKLTGGQRYFEDYGTTVDWHNAGRARVSELSPWDKTLLLDADYVVASDQLQTVLQSDQEFLCHSIAVDAARGHVMTGLNTFGNHKLPMAWATVIVYQKCQRAHMIFDCMTMIQNNWKHYCDLYGITKKTYRNDFALSIALNITNGHSAAFDSIPWRLPSVQPGDKLIQHAQDHYQVFYKNSDSKQLRHSIINQDFHAMGKQDLEAIVAAQ
jgi:hypothetical protein